MPAGRLTRQERQQIAAGLSDRLPYAEIARRLDRPTSTVTREVMRNGGPVAYRADLAQRATERRARGRRQVVARADAPVGKHPGRDPQAVAEFEEALTAVLVTSGLPKMPAQVLCCLLTADDSGVTAAELVQRLGVSPASVSKAVSFLEGQGLLRRERETGRRERYLADDDVWYQSTIASARANEQLSTTARQGAAILGPGSAAAARLENIARFLDFISLSIVRAAAEARDMLHDDGR